MPPSLGTEEPWLPAAGSGPFKRLRRSTLTVTQVSLFPGQRPPPGVANSNRTTLSVLPPAFTLSGAATASPARASPARSPTVKPCQCGIRATRAYAPDCRGAITRGPRQRPQALVAARAPSGGRGGRCQRDGDRRRGGVGRDHGAAWPWKGIAPRLARRPMNTIGCARVSAPRRSPKRISMKIRAGYEISYDCP